MDHAEVRTMLSAGELTPEAEGHLESCGECRTWSDALVRVRGLAVEVAVPAAPPGLAERSIAAARQWADRPAAAATALRAPRVPWWRRIGGRVALAAGLAAAVAAAALTIPDGRAGPAAIALVAAAEKTAGTGSARVEFSGTLRSTFELRVPELPRPAFPKEFLENLDRLPPEVREQVERFLVQSKAQIEASLPEQPMTFEITMKGTGEAVFPDRLHLRGTMTPKGSVPLPIGGAFELIVIADDAWIRMPVTGGTWVKVPAAQSPFRLTMKPGGFLDLMREGGSVEELGEEEQEGERVLHFRLTGRDDAPGPASGAIDLTVDFWIGAADGILRRAEFASAGRAAAPGGRAEVSSSGRLRLYDFGAGVAVRPPPGGEVTEGAALFGAGSFRMGMGDAGFSFAIDVSGSAGEPREAPPPEFVAPSPPPEPSPEYSPSPYARQTTYSETYSESSTSTEPSPYQEPSPYAKPSPYEEPSPYQEPSPSSEPVAS